MIRATCHTADDALTVEFNATPWFREADPASIVQVAGQGWSSTWIADALERRSGYEGPHQLIAYATNRLGLESLEDPAFASYECTVNGPEAPGSRSTPSEPFAPKTGWMGAMAIRLRAVGPARTSAALGLMTATGSAYRRRGGMAAIS